MPTFRHLDEVRDYDPGPRLLNSASPEEVAMGATTDIYFLRTYELLERLGKLDVPVVAEIFSSRAGVMAGSGECHNLLRERKVTVWALPEGEEFAAKEVIMRIAGPYGEFGLMETPLLGILASNTAWATAARQCRDAAKGRPVICFGARHVHPAVAPVMERAALVGGVSGASCIMAARLAGRQPAGTIPHAAVLIVGDTVTVAHAYHRYMPPDAPRIVLVDTFKDEAEESLRVAEALGEHLAGIRLDTPQERGGVTPELVREVKERLRQAGYGHVQVFVSGGLDPERISILAEAGADAFGVGSYISGAKPIDMTMDIKEVAGRPVAKRGRIPGLTPGTRLRELR